MNDATPLGSLGAVCRQEVGKIYQLSLIFTSVYNYRMDSRKYFVEQVASTIIKNHDHEDDSFIFGISGKWGEGKTRFLQDLEKELKKRDETFEILWINPWKFASDKISFHWQTSMGLSIKSQRFHLVFLILSLDLGGSESFLHPICPIYQI